MGWSKYKKQQLALYAVITGTPLHPRPLYPHSNGIASTLGGYLHSAPYSTKIQNQLVAIPFPPIVSPATYYGRYDHNLKYVVPAATIDVYKFSFFPRVIRIWNHLPAQAVNTKGTVNFKEAALPVLRLMQPPVGSSIL